MPTGAKIGRSADAEPLPGAVGFFSTYGGFGGTEQYLDQLVRSAAAMGLDVVFFHPATSPQHWVEQMQELARPVLYGEAESSRPTDDPSPGPAPSTHGNAGLVRRVYRRLVPQPVRFAMGFVQETLRLQKVFTRHPVDFLHFSDLGAEPAVAAARLAGIKRVTGALNCMPNTNGIRRSSAYHLIESLCLCCADAMAAVSRHGLDLWFRRARFSPRKARVIYNGTEAVSIDDVEETSRRVRKELGIPEDARVVGVSATLAPRKGHAYLLAALPVVLQTVPNAWLVLAGDGPSRGDLERQAEGLGVADRAIFLGHRTDISRVVQAYDVIALTSTAIESMPFALLEGMAYGKPALATASGGMPELVEDGVSGFVVPTRDSAAIARALIELLRDRDRTRRMGMAARRRVLEHFNVEQMVRETMDMVLGRRPERE